MRRRGFLLVLTLMVAVLLLTVGMGFLAQRAGQYRAGRSATLALAARAAAEAGLEDVRIKLWKDPGFPPLCGDGDTLFSYTEQLYDIDQTTVVGQYTVTIDASQRKAHQVLLIDSVGWVGPADQPLARRWVRGEFDMSPVNRSTGNPPNANLHTFINVELTPGAPLFP